MAFSAIAINVELWQVAIDPIRNRIMIVMGIAAKLLIAAIAIGHVVEVNIWCAFAALTTVDLVFAILFWRFLSSHPYLTTRTDAHAS